MTYATEKERVGSKPISIVEIDFDICSLTYGVGACTATGTGDGKCFNTRKTCQVTTAYAQTTCTHRFCEAMEGLPAGIAMIPSMISQPAISPTRITPDYGLGYRASVTVTLQDHPHHDRGVDPYVSGRTYDPEAQGTFWGKMRARNPHYQARALRLRTGYLTDPFDWANFENRNYVIEEIRGPDATGQVTIIAKDVLKLTDHLRAKCPVASGGVLAAALTDVATSMSVVGGTYDDPTAGNTWVRVGSELIKYTGRSGSGTSGDPWVLTGLDRTDTTWGSTAAAHDIDDSVQMCKAWESVNIRDIMDELLTDYAGIASSYINATDWDQEETDWLGIVNLSTILSEPTGVEELLSELQEQAYLNIWHNEIDEEIKMKAVVAPLANITDVLTDAQNFIAGSVSIKDLAKDRLTQVWFHYDKADYTSNDISNYKKLYVASDPNAESAEQYGDARIKVIKSRWLTENNEAVAAQTAGRYLDNRRVVPREIRFSLDAKDSDLIWTGDLINIETDHLQGTDGAALPTKVQVIEAKEAVPGHRYDYIAMTGLGEKKRWFIGPDTLLDYTSESQANQDAYGFVSNNSGYMSNGDLGATII